MYVYVSMNSPIIVVNTKGGLTDFGYPLKICEETDEVGPPG